MASSCKSFQNDIPTGRLFFPYKTSFQAEDQRKWQQAKVFYVKSFSPSFSFRLSWWFLKVNTLTKSWASLKQIGTRLILVFLWVIQWRLHVLFFSQAFLDIIFSYAGAAGEPMPRARAPYHMWYPSSVGQGNGKEFNRNIVFSSVLLFLLVFSFVPWFNM